MRAGRRDTRVNPTTANHKPPSRETTGSKRPPKTNHPQLTASKPQDAPVASSNLSNYILDGAFSSYIITISRNYVLYYANVCLLEGI